MHVKRKSALVVRWLLALVAVSVCSASTTALADDTEVPPRCAPSLSSAPTIDGTIQRDSEGKATENGWKEAANFLLVDTATGNKATLYLGGMSAGENLSDMYIGMVVDHMEPKVDVTIVWGFSSRTQVELKDPVSDATKDWRFIIRPFVEADLAGTSKENLHLQFGGPQAAIVDVKYGDSTEGAPPAWDSLTTIGSGDIAGGWLAKSDRFAYARTTSSWSFEARIPRVSKPDLSGIGENQGIWLNPLYGSRLYVSVMNNNTFGVGQFQEHHWPAGATMVQTPGVDVSKATPDKNTWEFTHVNVSQQRCQGPDFRCNRCSIDPSQSGAADAKSILWCVGFLGALGMRRARRRPH